MNVLKEYLRGEVKMDAAVFRSGAGGFSPVYSWVWNSPITREGIRTGIDEMKRAGITAFYVIPLPREFRPTWMITTLTPDYLSDEFFALIRYAVSYAAEQGMTCWLYDEGGWPSGGACGQVVKALPETARKVLAERPVTLPAGMPYTSSPDASAAFLDRRRVQAGETFATETCLREFYCKADSRQFTDFYDPRATKGFLNCTHRAYARALGEEMEKIPAMFIDEPSGNALAYSPYISRRFLGKYGYPIEDHLYVLRDTEAPTEVEAAVRLDYAHLLCDLFCEAMETIRGTLREMGLLSVGHMDNDHIPDGSVRNGYGNIMRCLRALDVPGVDVILGHITPGGEAPVFFPRMASSAASQNGTALALTESCSVYGNSLSPDDIRYICNAQLVRGINVFNLMLIPYSTADWYGYGQRPFFHPNIPGFYHLGAMNTELAREAYFMSHGRHMTGAALFYPHADLWRGDAACAAISRTYDGMGVALEQAGVDFDIVDADVLETATVTNGRLVCGGASYAAVYLPQGATLPPALREKLAPFICMTPPPPQAEQDLLRRTNCDQQGNLYICYFNAQNDTRTARITVDTALPLYRFSPADGKITRFQNGGEYTFARGECLLLYATAEAPETDRERAPVCSETPVCHRATAVRRMVTAKEGVSLREIHETTEPDSFARMFGEDFSGEVLYEYTVDLAAPTDACLTFERVDCSAAVTVNGTPIGCIACSPYRIEIPASLLRAGKNEIGVTVANLAANAYAAADIERHWDAAHLGPYHAPSLARERDAVGGGLAGARLWLY